METRADAVVVFGVTGDLAHKKLFPALYQLKRRGQLVGPVVGVGRSAWEDWQLVAAARKSLGEVGSPVDMSVFDEFASHLTMVAGDYADPGLYERLVQRLDEAAHPLFYLAVPPAVFPHAIAGLTSAGLADRGRIVVEKPFGHDGRSARSLDDRLRSAFKPDRIYRIDHYLGKESVEGLLAFRFANALFEPVWNRDHIARVEVTMAEKFGTQGRAGFYDGVGAVRDVLQNHMLQVVALLAMEPPVGPDAIAEETLAVLRRMRKLSLTTTVRGQYAGYRDEPGVDPLSTTETFTASRLEIASPRWQGVPFLLRVGKHLRANAAEAVIVLRRRPADLFTGERTLQPEPNLLRLRFGHDDGVTISFQAKVPGPDAVSRTVELSTAPDSAPRQEAYERLIEDVINGRRHRFVSAEAIEEQWRIVQPLLDVTEQPLPYQRGSWGPNAAESLSDGWHEPHLPRERTS
ncbi:glucose-6-phosphate dehydrogenase [Streptomyces sp. NPDC005708]|uniref:glucose-6-phosphate dehydrogenase n=1 Tax=Streptomyces sp. NPDC005708 TaxID=3154564 RepID=UPI0033EEDB2E